MSECTKILPINIPNLKKMVDDLQQRYEENIETELNEDETKVVKEFIDKLQDIITKVNEHFRIKISFDNEKFENLLKRLYRLPDLSDGIIGGNGSPTLTNGEPDVIEVSRRSTLSYDFSAIFFLLLGICLIYIAYNIILQTPEQLTKINPLFKEIYDVTVSNYGTNEVTLLAFIWNSITNFSCSEHTAKIENIITILISQSMKSGMVNALQTATTTCIMPTTLVSTNTNIFGVNIGNMINIGATTVTTMLNHQQITLCTTAAMSAAQGKFMSDMAFYNKLLITSTGTQVRLISNLVTMGIGLTYSSSLYLIYRTGQEALRIVNRQIYAPGPTPLAINDGLEPKGGKLRKKPKN